jgi:hypothetical protein
MDYELRRIWDRLEEGENWLLRGGSDMGDPRYSSLGHRLGQAMIVTLEEELGRVQRVRRALDKSGPRAERMIAERLAGIDFSTVWSILIQAVKDIAFYLGGSVALGTVGGAAVGAIFGGAGAIPGAYVGGSIGAEVGGLILGFLGLKCLAEGLIETLPEAARCYRDGIMQAWGANHWDHENGCPAGLDGNLQFAAAKIARGHVLLLTALLMAMLAYLTRGKGNRSRLLKELRESRRLGPKVAEWLEKNEQKLAEHPSLKVRERPLVASEEAPSQAMTPSQIRRAIRERAEGAKAQVLARAGRAPNTVLPSEPIAEAGNAVSNGGVTADTAPGAINLMKGDDPFFVNASKRADVDPDGFLDVIAHGNETHIEVQTTSGPMLMDAKQAAQHISSLGEWSGQNVRLLSCSTGACMDGFAAQLQVELGVSIVRAPSDILWADTKGNLFVSAGRDVVDPVTGATQHIPTWPPTGKFVDFTSGGSK